MTTLTIIFAVLSVVMIGYIIYSTSKSKRISLLSEIFYILIYLAVFLVAVFPKFFDEVAELFGVYDLEKFLILGGIFLSYILIFQMYKQTEIQRGEITALTRQIAYLKHSSKKENKKWVTILLNIKRF